MERVAALAIRVGSWVYRLMRLLPTRRKVALLSRQSATPSRDMRMLAEHLRARDPRLEVVLRCKAVPESRAGKLAYSAEVLVQMYHLATSKVVVVDGYIAPVSVFDHGSSPLVIQMWHALGAIKKFGLQAIGRPGGRSEGLARAMRIHHGYDLVVCGGEPAIGPFAEAFGVERSQVLPLGLPRVDYLLENAAAGVLPAALDRLRAANPVLDDPDRIKVLYAPTFRGDRATALDDVIDAFPEESYTLVLKPHPREMAACDRPSVVRAEGEDILDLLLLADVVITDYSAVAFEAAILEKPLFFYVADIGLYREEQGLNIDPLVEFSELADTDIEAIERRVASGSYTVDAVRSLRDTYVSRPPGGCTSAIADVIFETLGDL